MKNVLFCVILIIVSSFVFAQEDEDQQPATYVAYKAGWGQDYGLSWGAGFDFRKSYWGGFFGLGFDNTWGDFTVTWAAGIKLHWNRSLFSSSWLSAGVSDVSLYENPEGKFTADSLFLMAGYSMLFQSGIYIDAGIGFLTALHDVFISLPITGTVSIGLID
jgi:hypothetical protein